MSERRQGGDGPKATAASTLTFKRTKVFAAAAWMRMIRVGTAWNEYHILTSPRILDSPGLAIASGVVMCLR